MKNILIAICLLFVSAYAANVNVLMKKQKTNVYDAVQSDTLGINTGNTKTFLADTAESPDQGILQGNLIGDSVWCYILGYASDDDTSAAQCVLYESPNAHLTWIAIDTDTLRGYSTTAERVILKAGNNPNCSYKAVIEAYGTTDSVSILKVRMFGGKR